MPSTPYPIHARIRGIVDRPEGRSLENPSTPLSAPDDWLYDALGSYRASSGVNVNSQTALTYAAVWRAVNLISGDVGRLPLCPYKTLGLGRQKDTRHPSYMLVRRKPNSEMTSMVFKKTLQAHTLLTGNGYGYIERARNGKPLQLIPLNPTQIYPVRANGKLWYVIDIPNLDARKIDPSNIFHVRGLSYDGLIGYSVVAKARESLGLGMAMQSYGSVYFRNNAQPRVVLVYPHALKPEAKQNLRESWERLHSGLENAHRTAILEAGVDIKTISINARDSQLIESRAFEIREVANWFSLPPSKLGDSARTSYNSLEQEQQQYLDEGLSPWLTTWEEECWDKLLSDEEKEADDHHFEFDTRSLLRANLAARGQWYQLAIQAGILNPNECRAEEGYNPRQDDGGQQYAQALNLAWVGGDGPDVRPTPPAEKKPDDGGGKEEKPPGQQPAPGADEKEKNAARQRLLAAHRELIADVARRMVRRIAVHAGKAAKEPERFAAALDSLVADHRGVVAQALEPALAAAYAASSPGPDALSAASSFLEVFRQQLGELEPPDLEGKVEGFLQRAVVSFPNEFAKTVLEVGVERAKPDKPGRSTEDALDILDRLPDVEDKPGEVALPMPVEQKPPYTVKPEDLAGAKKKTVKLRKLIGTRATLKRERVKAFIKDPDQPGSLWKVGGGLPLDLPYVIRSKGNLYIYDGHHRLMARQLLGTVKTRVYFLKDKD